jgi:hypothetical protein
VGTISASLPPTWNWVALEFTHAARAGECKAHEIAANKNPTATPMRRLRVMMVIPCLHLLLEEKSSCEQGSNIVCST